MGRKATALLDLHRHHGARLIDFAGWEMPLQYRGIVAEHNAVRTDVGVFDVSHLGKLTLEGDAEAALQKTVTADLASLEPGRAAYALVLEKDGGCVDDVFVYRSHDGWLVVPNAANVDAVADQIRRSGGDPVDAWDRWSILAIQGPRAYGAAGELWPDLDLKDMKLHHFQEVSFDGEAGYVARTGYTGEPGIEAYVPTSTSPSVFRKLIGAGVAPVGLGARDTLRLEMGYALYGHELDRSINPLEAGLGWAISWDRDFRGKDALGAIRADGPARRLFGIRCRERGVPRQGYVVTHEGRAVGTVTSGNFSPTLGTGIALALGPRSEVPEEGAAVEIDARGRALAGDIVRPPFVDRGRKRSTS